VAQGMAILVEVSRIATSTPILTIHTVPVLMVEVSRIATSTPILLLVDKAVDFLVALLQIVTSTPILSPI
jgi:hypothetical protein